MKERFIYLDAAKGIGILLIVLVHTGVTIPIPMIEPIKVVLFFLISGFFIKSDGELMLWIKKNCKSILIPFIFFYLISYLFYYLGKFFIPDFSEMTSASGILDCFTQKQYFNGPLWFLPCLFWMKFFVYFTQRKISSKIVQVFVVIVLGSFGFLLNKLEIDFPLALDTALTLTPIMYLGNFLWRNSSIQKYSKTESAVFSVVLYSSGFSFSTWIWDSMNRYGGGYFQLLAFCIVLTLAVVFACKCFLNSSIVLSFIGRNSMWIMCTHHLLYRPIRLILDRMLVDSNTCIVLTCILTIIICCATAPLINRYCPTIVGKG